MRKTYLCVLPLALVMLAYSADSIAQEIECEKAPDPAAKCEGEPQAPAVILNLEAMTANPQCVRAYPGTTLIFRLVPKKDLQLNSIIISPKDPDDDWLEGRNDVIENLIIIDIPGVHDPDDPHGKTDHYYRIDTPKKCLDPRVQVDD